MNQLDILEFYAHMQKERLSFLMQHANPEKQINMQRLYNLYQFVEDFAKLRKIWLGNFIKK